MRLLTKLMRLRAALAEVIDELDDDGELQTEVQQEAEILLTRSAKNRRSDKNTVMTMSPLNGAPAVPESWKVRHRGPRSDSSDKNRAVLAKILIDHEAMTRIEVWKVSREVDSRLRETMAQKNFQQMVNRMLRVGQLELQRGKLVMGQV